MAESQIGEYQEVPKNRKNFRRIALLSGSLLVAGFLYSFFSDDSGELEVIPPRQIATKFYEKDNSLNVVSWNMHNEAAKKTSQLKKLAEEYKLDALLLQEVSRNDEKSLARSFPGWWTTYVMADKRTKSTEGGYGNLVMTRQEPKDIKTAVFEGSSLPQTVMRSGKGIIVDTAGVTVGDADFSAFKKGSYQENRSVVSLTIHEQVNGEYQDVRLINTHLGVLPDTNQKQFEEFLKFLQKETSGSAPAVVCGDMNREPNDVIPPFSRLQFITDQTTATSIEGVTLDYCGYKTGGYLALGEVVKLEGPKTDHYPLYGSWIFADSPQP